MVTVRKHSSMGCAVVSMTDVRVRQARMTHEVVGVGLDTESLKQKT